MEEFGSVTSEGEIKINPNKAATDTPIHEYAHIWTKLLKAKNNSLYMAGIALVKKNEELMDYVRTSRPDLVKEEDIAEEALVTAIGEEGSDFFNTLQQRNALKRFLDKLSEFIRKTFNLKKRVSWSQRSDMTLKEFTNLAAQDLLNGTEISKLTNEDVKKIMSEELILDSINIDSNLLSDKGATLLEKGADNLSSIIMSQGKLPKWVSNLDNNTRSAIEGTISEASRTVKQFNKALKEHIDANNLSKAEVEKLMLDINETLQNKQTSNATATKNFGMSVDLITSITAMRNTIDGLSQVLIDGGYLTKYTSAKVNENLGSYLTRSYEIIREKPKTSSEWLDKLNKNNPEILARAKEFIVEQYKLAKVAKINFVNKGEGRYEVTLENEYNHKSKKVIMSKADIIAILQEGNPNIITDGSLKELEASEGFIELSEEVNPKKYGINMLIKDADVDKEVNRIISKHLGVEGVMGIAGLNKKEIGILKKRKDIPEEIRDLLGEIKDPAANFIETVSKMASLIEYSKFLKRLKEEGTGTLIYDKDNRPPEAVRISKDRNPKWAPLDGMYTTKEFLDALKDYESDGLVNVKGNGRAIDSAINFSLMLNTIVKSSLTKWNIPSNFRNHYGAIMMATRMGYANPLRFAKDVASFFSKTKEQSDKGMIKAYSDFYKGMSSKEKENFDKEEFNTMRRLGLIDDSVGFQTYKNSIKLAMKNSGKITELSNRLNKSEIGKAVKSPREIMDKVYLAPDAAAKMYLFRNMKDEYSKAYPTLNDNQINEKVANIIKDTMPTFSKMSKIAKSLSRNPIFGSFSSFTTETVRNYFNQIRLIQQLSSDYKKATDP